MAPTLRNTSTPFVTLPGNGLGDFASEDGNSAPLLESPAPTEVQIAPIEDSVLVMVDAYPDQPHGLVAHEPPPNRHPIRRLAFAIRRATLAVLFAPVLVVAWFLLRIWWVAHLIVTRAWQGVTSAIAWVWSGIVAAVLAVVTGIRDATAHAVALVRAAFAAGVRGVLGAAAFVVGSVKRAIHAAMSFALGVCQSAVRLALGAVHATTSSIAAAGRRVWRVITSIRDAVVAAGAAAVALVTRASRIAAAPFIATARGLWFILRVLAISVRFSGYLVWRGFLLFLGGAAIVTGILFGLVLVGIYGVRILAATSIALPRAAWYAGMRVGRAAAAGVAAVGNGAVRSVVAFASAVHGAARLGGAAVLRVIERALTTGKEVAHAGALRSVAGLAAAAAFSTRAVHAAWTGTRATATASAREAAVLARTANRAAAARLLVASGVTGRAIEHTAALSHVAWESASRVKTRVYHESPVVRVNFAAVPGRAGDVRVAARLALASSVGFMLMAGGVALFLMPRAPAPSAPPPVAASRHAVAIPLEPMAAVQRQTEAVPPRPATPAAGAPVTAARRAPEPPATIEPKPAERSTLSAARVRAIWDKTDTRSLDRAMAEMRSATLAFRRCEMRMTSPDAATATCSESASPRVAWTFDFRRNDERWLIEGVSTTGTPPVAR